MLFGLIQESSNSVRKSLHLQQNMRSKDVQVNIRTTENTLNRDRHRQRQRQWHQKLHVCKRKQTHVLRQRYHIDSATSARKANLPSRIPQQLQHHCDSIYQLQLSSNNFQYHTTIDKFAKRTSRSIIVERKRQFNCS